jgi:hypothetical protein
MWHFRDAALFNDPLTAARVDAVSAARSAGASLSRSYGRYVRRLLRTGEPAVLHLPAACRRWRLGAAEVYDIACVATRQRGAA